MLVQAEGQPTDFRRFVVLESLVRSFLKSISGSDASGFDSSAGGSGMAAINVSPSAESEYRGDKDIHTNRAPIRVNIIVNNPEIFNLLTSVPSNCDITM